METIVTIPFADTGGAEFIENPSLPNAERDLREAVNQVILFEPEEAVRRALRGALRDLERGFRVF